MERKRNKDGTYGKEDYSIYIGKTYGKLTIIEVSSNYRDEKRCKCKCECGNQKEVSLNSLLKGTTKSCGCIMKNIDYDNLIGRRFGNLVVIEQLAKSKLSQAKYRCLCDCGNYIEVYGSNLLYNQTKSCGCIHKVSLYNTKPFSNNTSGVRGVHFETRNNRWTAKLTVKGTVYKKSFINFEEAVAYRKFLEDKYHRPLRDKYNKFKQKNN